MQSENIEILINELSNELSQLPNLSHNIQFNGKQNKMIIGIKMSVSNYKIIFNFIHNYALNGIDFSNKCKFESISKMCNSTQSTLSIDTHNFTNFMSGDIISYNGLSIEATSNRIIKIIKLLK